MDSSRTGSGSSFTRSKQLPSPPRTNTPIWTNNGGSSGGGVQMPVPVPRVSTPQRRGTISSLTALGPPTNRSSSPEKRRQQQQQYGLQPSHTISSIHTRKGSREQEGDETLRSLLLPLASSHARSNSNSSSSYYTQQTDLSPRKLKSNANHSLVHLLPTLTALGMTSSAHLRAVARLSPETRDREVREEALRRGVSVVEWAILLDRIMGWEGGGR